MTEQLSLPSIDGYTVESYKTSISGSITEGRDQPARPLRMYDDVVGIVVGSVGPTGGDPLFVDGKPAPARTQKVSVTQFLVPLSEETKRDLSNLLGRIYAENLDAGLSLGLVDEDEVPQARAS